MVMRKFEPSEEQRDAVAVLASTGRVSQEEIAGFITNPRTNRAVSVKVLRRMFKAELAENTELKRLLVEKFTAAVSEGAPWAIKFGMEHIVGFGDGGSGRPGVVINNNQLNAEKVGIKVAFVGANGRLSETPIYPDGLRPLPKEEHIAEAHLGFPRRIEHEPHQSQPPRFEPSLPTHLTQEPIQPEPTPVGPKGRAAALKERFRLEGMDQYSDHNPRAHGTLNKNWDSRIGPHGGYKK